MHAPPLPVISIGNLSAGGTGKTPATAYIAKGLASRGRKPAILMRGYGAAKSGESNDEARELQRAAPQIPVIVNPKRIEGAHEAKRTGCDGVILDDGFQHWQLKRNLDIVLIDATRPLASAHRLPWGYLREHPAALKRADVVLLTRSNAVAAAKLTALETEIKRFAQPETLIARTAHRPAGLRTLRMDDSTLSLNELKGKQCFAACGLGNPGAFFKTVESLGAVLVGSKAFADHHSFSASECQALLTQAKASNADAVIITEKDAVKWEPLAKEFSNELPVWVLGVEFQMLSGEAELWAHIERAYSV